MVKSRLIILLVGRDNTKGDNVETNSDKVDGNELDNEMRNIGNLEVMERVKVNIIISKPRTLILANS